MTVVRVAAGVLRQPDGRILLAQRPAGKIAAGRWEFPGGKIETGETPREALARELQEEIGIEVTLARPLICLRHAYIERTVELDTWLISDWRGQPQGLEQQALAWAQPDAVDGYDILEADDPILNALRLPECLPVTGAFADTTQLLQRAEQVFRAGFKLLRLRAPALDDAQYTAAAQSLAECASKHHARILLDRPDHLLDHPACAGLHLRSPDLQRLSSRPVLQDRWLLASVHNANDIAQAQRLNVDALVLGPVLPTASHPQQPTLGWSAFSDLVAQAHVPVYAIGGQSKATVQQAQTAGGQGVAAISAWWQE